MKKIYIQPTSKAIEVENEEIIATSEVCYGGSNKNGGPTTAEEDDYRSNLWGD